MSKWQPIETAPRDGRQVLLSGSWDGRAWVWQGWFDHEDERGWFAAGSHWTDAYDGSLEHPTHWMPLPPPPEAKP